MSHPAPAEIERIYWSSIGRDPLEADRKIHAHIARCPECSAQIRDIAELAALGEHIEPSAWQRQEEIRTTLLSSARPVAKTPARARRWRWLVPAVLTAAAAATVLIVRWPSGGGETAPDTTSSYAVILDHGTTRHLVVSPSPDEIVRLVDGTITVTVGPLAAGERFRVVTGDGEVDAPDAAFDVTVANDHLVSVRAIRGAATVKVAGFERILHAGEIWKSPTKLADVTPPPMITPAVVAVAPRVEGTPAPPRRVRTPEPITPEPEAVPAVVLEPTPPAAPPPAPRSMVQQAFDDGWTALRAGNFTTAATAFERATAVTTDQRMLEDATYWRGVALARGGEVGVAAHVFTAFLTAYPSSPRAAEVSTMLGWILVERGDIAAARVRFEAALQSPSREVRESAAAGVQATIRP